MARSDAVFNLRLPEELKERVVDAAARNKRSINSEIISAIEYSLSFPLGEVLHTPIGELERRVSELEKKISDINKKPA